MFKEEANCPEQWHACCNSDGRDPITVTEFDAFHLLDNYSELGCHRDLIMKMLCREQGAEEPAQDVIYFKAADHLSLIAMYPQFPDIIKAIQSVSPGAACDLAMAMLWYSLADRGSECVLAAAREVL